MDAKLPARNILVVQLAKMGDFLQTIPLLQGIQAQNPQADLSVLIDSRNAELATQVPFLKDILPLDLSILRDRVNDPTLLLSQKYVAVRDLLQGIRDRRFEVVYNINFSRISALLCQFFKDAEIIGYRLNPQTQELLKENWVNFVFHLMNDRKLIRFNLVDLLAGYTGEKPLSFPPLFAKADGETSPLPFPDDGEKTIALQLGCGGELRRWPTESFARLALRLVEEGRCRVVLLGSAAERDLGNQFLENFRRFGWRGRSAEVFNLIGKTSISQLAASLKKCDLLITGDTGTMHWAAAVGTKILALFMGTAYCHETGPYGEGHFIIQALLPCSPCIEGMNSCLEPACQKAISPDTVYEIASRILNPCQSSDMLPEGLEALNHHGCLQVYKTAMDEWGVKFLPLIRKEVDIQEVMALVYREVCRNLILPYYQIDIKKMQNEFSSHYYKLNSQGFRELEKIKKNLSQLHSFLAVEDKKLTAESRKADPCLKITVDQYFSTHPVLKPLRGYFLEMTGNGVEQALLGNKKMDQTNQGLPDIINIIKKILSIISVIKPVVSP